MDSSDIWGSELSLSPGTEHRAPAWSAVDAVSGVACPASLFVNREDEPLLCVATPGKGAVPGKETAAIFYESGTKSVQDSSGFGSLQKKYARSEKCVSRRRETGGVRASLARVVGRGEAAGECEQLP